MNNGSGALTDICLFVGLDEFSELKVASNDGHLETRARKRKTWRSSQGIYGRQEQNRTSKEKNKHTHTQQNYTCDP